MLVVKWVRSLCDFKMYIDWLNGNEIRVNLILICCINSFI